jgi:hypothetical protein
MQRYRHVAAYYDTLANSPTNLTIIDLRQVCRIMDYGISVCCIIWSRFRPKHHSSEAFTLIISSTLVLMIVSILMHTQCLHNTTSTLVYANIHNSDIYISDIFLNSNEQGSWFTFTAFNFKHGLTCAQHWSVNILLNNWMLSLTTFKTR